MATDFEQLLLQAEYPTTDGQPMAETDLHREVLFEVLARLSAWFASRQDVYVSGNMMVYYEEGEPRTHLAPDCYVVFGIPKGQRDVYKTWVEGKFPDIVFELTSKSTQKEDMKRKRWIYEHVWRVKEYYLFDPRGEYLEPNLLGYCRTRGKFVPMPIEKNAIESPGLGLRLVAEGSHLRFFDPSTGREVLPVDAEHARQAEERAKAAESEVARLQAELDAIRQRKA